MTTTPQLLAFGGIIVLGAMSPGPDFAVVVRHSAVSGRTHGTLAAAGIAAGVFGWAVAAASGVAALVTLVPVAFTVIKLVGAGYLAYLGLRAVGAARRAGGLPLKPAAAAARRPGRWAAFRDGLLCNILNPKAAVFFVALLPQFLPADPGLVDTVTLSVVAVAITGAWFVAVATLVAGLRRVFARPGVRRAVDGLTGVVLIGLGVRLALTSAR
ncbi:MULTISPECIES: LysE family translocator [Micromonospora]|uniref:LysE family translocator n=1 Tax=Micromonospora solifontis TaxID=2487138 RepID=A0ABX9W9S9_9ACTN|nr:MULTISPECIES: LysE family translocator [Micromonospora]NES16873.1 LysE family translocator [Micromonospora sp. PPF5-17B]NES39190.1 LysE family translocator [Micromonospora solifontis]NES58929.1 LysE family translocator [Micromonospora sp. PPF5-6]RNL90337.1 LysE family translocator [Micromonospora solifontis]